MPPSNVGKAASKRSAVPTIACINKASVCLGVDFDALIAALQEYVNKHLERVWNTPAKLINRRAHEEHAWTLIFFDSAEPKDVKGLGIRVPPREVLGRHKLEHHGLPLAMVFVNAALSAGPTLPHRDKVGIAASHELAEMLVDPGNNLWCERSEGSLYAYEVCDAVEEEHFFVHGIAMSDFVYPTYFEEFQPKSVQFDHMKKVNRPFQILERGYMPLKEDGQLKIVFGSREKKQQFDEEDRRLHRIGFGTKRLSPKAGEIAS